MKFLALIIGGLGPDVWDKEKEIDAADFQDAARQAQGIAEDLRGQVFSLEGWEYPTDAKTTIANLQRENAELKDEVELKSAALKSGNVDYRELKALRSEFSAAKVENDGLKKKIQQFEGFSNEYYAVDVELLRAGFPRKKKIGEDDYRHLKVITRLKDCLAKLDALKKDKERMEVVVKFYLNRVQSKRSCDSRSFTSADREEEKFLLSALQNSQEGEG